VSRTSSFDFSRNVSLDGSARRHILSLRKL
jgi:hypothetical protein